MRRRLALLSLATTGLVVVALVVPLGILVRRQAADRVQVAAERTAQSTAALVALSLALGADPGSLRSAVPIEEGVILVLPGGEVLGEPREGQGSLVAVAETDQAVASSEVPGGWELAVPVVAREGVVVVDVFVPGSELTRGVAEAWALLALLGLVLVGLAMGLADRLGRRLVEPIGDLAEAARRLGEGELEAQVIASKVPELRQVGEAFNWLAGRLSRLLAEEREAAADLSHRLRTPLTALRLRAEKLSDPTERSEVTGQVDRVEQAIDQVIRAARAEPEPGSGRADLGNVIRMRSAFWAVLAEEQGRAMEVEVTDEEVTVPLAAETVEAMFDALIGNVFSHTPAGVDLAVTVNRAGERVLLQVSDGGPGFPDAGALGRGVSGAGSTGLGLDIVRRTAEATGGSLEIDDRPGGGAVVRVWLGGRV